jgi:sugar phosphate isomerase/epimerase
MTPTKSVTPDLIASCWTAAGNADALGGNTPSPIDLRTRIEAAAKAGWSGMGLLHADLIQARDTIGYPVLRQILEDNGIIHVELEYLMDWWEIGVRRATSDRVRAELFAAVEPLNPIHIKIGPGVLEDPVESAVLRESWSNLCEDAATCGVRIALESAPYSYFPSVESIVRLVTEVGHANGGLLLDIWHVYRSSMGYAEMAKIVPREILFAVEVNDAKAKAIGTLLEDTINNRELCGQGDADVPGFIRAIDQIGFDGPWGVEIISDVHRARPIDEALEVAYTTTKNCFNIARGSRTDPCA